MRLGTYEVVQRLSHGASAEVFLARPPDTHQRVIVELIRPELFGEAELVARFLDEVRVRRALRHPNVARRVIEGTADDGRPFVVSEAVGESLADWLRVRGPLDPETLIKLAIPLCDALHYLHERGMVHGNLKPATVHLGPDGVPQRPKLVDYGLALLRPGRTLPRPPGRILVEPAYLAPERVRGQRGTVLSDLYALGVLMYEALTGAPPFTGTDAQGVRVQHLERTPPPLPESCRAIEPIVMRCLAKAPEARFPSALAVREALAAQLEGTLPLQPQVESTAVMYALDGGGPERVRDPDAPPEAGDVIGRYTLVEPIGEGAMGRVFLARHTRLGRMVALKLLKPEHARNRDHVERFVREARAVNRIRNEHIVEIFDLVDEEQDTGQRRVYCVMELLQGQTLGDLLKNGPIPLRRALFIMQHVATALDAAHRAGVVHRDIKPDNIFLTERDGEDFAKVVDFGIAKLKQAADPVARVESGPPSLSRTAFGAVLGTPAYMAPEQVMAKAVDHRVDVYAFGAVLYKLLSGTTPFAATNFADLAAKISSASPAALPRMTASGEPIPPALASLVMDCLQKDPAARPQSASEIVARLEAIRTGSPAPVAREREPMVRRTVVGLALGAILLSAGVVTVPVRTWVDAALGGRAAAQSAPVTVTLSLTSEPAGATVQRVDTGEELGMTPVTLTVPRGLDPVRLRFSKRGYEPAQIELAPSRDASAHVALRPRSKRSRRAGR